MLSNPADQNPFRAVEVYIASACIIVLCLINITYFARLQGPTYWDDSSYLHGSLLLYDALTTGGIFGFLESFAHLFESKAPLISALPIPLYLVFGRDHDPRALVGVFLIIAMSVYLFRLGSLLWSRHHALLAVAITQTMPLIYGLSRQFLTDYGLATLVVMWIYYLLAATSFTSTRTILRLAVVLGLGLLMKVSFPLYVAGPTIATVLGRPSFSLGDSRVNRMRGLLIAGLLGVALAGIWYIPNAESVLSFAFSASYGRLSSPYGSSNVFASDVILQYLHVLIVCGLSSYYFFAATGLVIICAAMRRCLWRDTPRYAILALALWILVPFVAAMLATNKDPRYTAPILPAVGLLLALCLFELIRPNRFWPILAALFFIVPAYSYSYSSFAFDRFVRAFSLGPFLFWSPKLAWYAEQPSTRGAWDQERVVALLCKPQEGVAAPHQTLIPLAHQYINNVNLEYMRVRQGCDVAVVGLPIEIQNEARLQAWLRDVNPAYVLVIPDVPEPELAPGFANTMKRAAEALIARENSGFALLYRGFLGASGKEFLIYRRL